MKGALQHTVIIKRTAQKQIEKIPKQYLGKIESAILNLSFDPRPDGCVKLAGSEHIFRIRVGVYRIVYEVIDRELMVYVVDVDHRKQIYRNR